MNFDRKPPERSGPADAAPRTLTPSTNPALRLQELLRREAQQARDTQSALMPPEDITPPPPPPPPQLDTCADTAPEKPSAAVSRPATEPVTLIVVVNSERSTPVEYASEELMPTVAALEETHGAFLLSDEWQRRGTTLLRVIRLRRRRR
jgi:hypothetical protein